ncbi:SUMF1/EgtB/PvdO family nonheme iron enzyme, partial [Myxococcota bacterium]|nr:SUMF1/EgtB/PvdO family nonheme iron enzyme [Myxococcota bacterium]
PTEAEWEYLARAGTQSATYGGDLTSLDCNTDPASSTLAWYCGNASSGSQASGALLPNAFGLYDMLGNVHEWVLEIFGDYSSGTQSTPEVVPSSGWYEELLVARGGAWNRGTQDSRAARRVAYAAGARNYALGFRLVRSLYDFDFSRYTLIPSERSWEEAEADCQSRGDHLLSITTHRENMLIRKMVGLYNVQYDTNFGSFWTGLNDREDYNGEDNWVFSDGSSLGEEFWYWSADSDDDRDCVYSWLTDMRQSRSWLAYYCSNEFSYICEAPEI